MKLTALFSFEYFLLFPHYHIVIEPSLCHIGLQTNLRIFQQEDIPKIIEYFEYKEDSHILHFSNSTSFN